MLLFTDLRVLASDSDLIYQIDLPGLSKDLVKVFNVGSHLEIEAEYPDTSLDVIYGITRDKKYAKKIKIPNNYAFKSAKLQDGVLSIVFKSCQNRVLIPLDSSPL